MTNSPEVESENLIDIEINENLFDFILFLKKEMGYTTIHLTGGEPTTYSNLVSLVRIIKELGMKITIVTNLVDITTIKTLVTEHLIDELTYSYVPKDRKKDVRKESLKNFKTSSYARSRLVNENVLKIRKLDENLKIKSNIIISGLSDIDECIDYMNFCFANNIDPRFQRDRYDDRIKGSTEAVNSFIEKLNLKPSKIVIRVPGASETCHFYDLEGRVIKFKIFNQNVRIYDVCEVCDRLDVCDKCFSAFRLFNSKGEVKVAICAKYEAEHTMLSLQSFINSKAQKEIMYYKDNMDKYFNKVSSSYNFQ